MSGCVCVSRARFAFRLAVTGVAAGLLAGCSNSERLSDPWSNPFQTSANVEGQVPAAPGAGSPVQSRPLGTPMASAAPRRGSQGAVGWSAQGGSPIVVAPCAIASSLPSRYGVPVDALVRTNGFASASQVRPGTHIVIPVYNAALAASSGARVAANSAPKKPAAPAKVAGAPPRTLASQAASLKAGKRRAPAPKAAAARNPTAPATKQETTQAPRTLASQAESLKAGNMRTPATKTAAAPS